MSYVIEITKKAFKDLKVIPHTILKNIKKAIDALAKNPTPDGCKKLKGAISDYYRIRRGDFRIIYTIDKGRLIILVIRIGHRRDIYKKLGA